MSTTDISTSSESDSSESSTGTTKKDLAPLVFTHTPSLQLDSGSTPAVWSNVTVGDVWSFDGWHAAKSLVDTHPDVFRFVSQEMRYSNPEFVPEEEEKVTADKSAEAASASTDTDSEAKSGPTVAYHILGAASSIRRQKQYEELARQMKEQFQTGQDLDAALGLIDTLQSGGKVNSDSIRVGPDGRKITGKSAKFGREHQIKENYEKKYSTDSGGDEEGTDLVTSLQFWQWDFESWLLHISASVSILTVLALYRASRRIKFRPTKQYIERERKRL